jgi:hypothetical protein
VRPQVRARDVAQEGLAEPEEALVAAAEAVRDGIGRERKPPALRVPGGDGQVVPASPADEDSVEITALQAGAGVEGEQDEGGQKGDGAGRARGGPPRGLW